PLNKKGTSYFSQKTSSIHFLFPVHTVIFKSFPVGIGNQRKRQRKFLCKGPVRFFTVHAYTHNCNSPGNKFLMVVPEVACLSGTSGSVVFRIEIENQFLSCKVGQPDESA